MRSARQIAAGDYSARVDESNCGEISELAHTFNRMVDSFLRAERLRKDMVADVAHELRTPLTNIRGYLEALIDSVMEPSAEVLSSLHDETLRLVKLVEDLLQLARADAARSDLRLESVNLQSIIQQTLELFQLKFANKNIGVSTDLADANLAVHADPSKLAQILTNLYENAWRYTHPGGRTSVAAKRLPNAVKIVISNTPDGTLRADELSIFERFYRDEKSRSRDYGGAGLGLAIVKELVESHGGAVGWETFNDGICVWFTLPA
jgi:signal transduction histidine kinase